MENTNPDIYNLLAQAGASAVFAGLVLALLRNVLQKASEERSEWLRSMREDKQQQTEAMNRLSEVLVEMRTILRESTNKKEG